MITWRSPTDFEDPDAWWLNEFRSYDENTSTYADSGLITPGTWGKYLILKRAAVTCHRVRFNVDKSSGRIDSIDLDIYYDAAWHGLYEGDFTHHTWVEKIIDPDKSITKARIRCHNGHAEFNAAGNIYEFDFGEVSDPSAPDDLEVEGQTNPDHVLTLVPHFTAVFNANDTVNATHYQIQIGTTRLGSNKWDTGKQALVPECGDGERCKLIAYGGSALPFNTKYWWRLKFWDTDGKASPWSDS